RITARENLRRDSSTAAKTNPGPWLRTSLFACYARNEILVSTVRLSCYVRAINSRAKDGHSAAQIPQLRVDPCPPGAVEGTAPRHAVEGTAPRHAVNTSARVCR